LSFLGHSVICLVTLEVTCHVVPGTCPRRVLGLPKRRGGFRVSTGFVHLPGTRAAGLRAEECLKNQIQGGDLIGLKEGVDRIPEEVLRCSYTRKYKEKDVEKHLEPVRNRLVIN
jgi:hypothetical protein